MSEEISDQVLAWHAWFDAHPEPAWQEHETTAYLVEQVQGMGFTCRRSEGRTGALAELGSGPRWIGLRADLDAIATADGSAVHSCGHSAHMAIVLGAAQILSAAGTLPEGVGLRLLLQPAEETGTGALELIERGALDGMTDLFGLHLRPAEELAAGVFAPALHSGASATGVVSIRGQDAHGARPHLGRNAIDPLVTLHQLLTTIRRAPGESYSAKITQIRAGGPSLNVIPGTAQAAIDLRAQRNQVLDDLQHRIDEVAAGIAATYGVEIAIEWRDHTPGAEVHPFASATVAQAIQEVAGGAALEEEIVTPGADDFHYYAAEKPELRSTMLAVGVDLQPGLHNPTITYDTAPLPTAAAILARAVVLAAGT